MARSKALTIGGVKINPGESQDLQINFSESYLGVPVSYPVRVMRARQEGPKIFMTGAIHGDEINGVGIIHRLLFGDNLELKRGTLVCVPVVNIFGLEHHTRYLPDRRDLNRCFPGFPNGSLSSRLAYSLFEEIVKKCDYGLDFHSAAIRGTNYPNVRADMRNPKVRELARAFGCELIVNSKGPDESLRRCAVAAGIPTIILEAGEVWKIEPSVEEIGVRGCMNVLRAFGMIDGEPEKPLFQATIEKNTWVRAKRGGFLGFRARPGDLVKEGQELANNYNIYGRERSTLVSPCDGMVLGMTTMPAVKPGEPVYHIASLSASRFAQIRKKLKESSDEHLFSRVREDLATSVTILDDD